MNVVVFQGKRYQERRAQAGALSCRYCAFLKIGAACGSSPCQANTNYQLVPGQEVAAANYKPTHGGYPDA